MPAKKLSEPISPDHSPPANILGFHPADYEGYLSEIDLTEEQAHELLQTLWNIMSIFVDIGWGVDTVQLILPELFDEVANDNHKGGENE